MLCVFFSSYVLRNERKESSTTQPSFLMLHGKKANSSARAGLSSIKLSKEEKGALFSFSFKLKEITKFSIIKEPMSTKLV